MQLAGLASNRGRNLMNIADRAPGEAKLGVVLTNEADAPVLEKARKRGIPTEQVGRDSGESRSAHEERVVAALSEYEFDLVCLDGYMRILSDTFLDQMPMTLNVHPSLLPSFPGTDAWSDALTAGVSVTGCTVHAVVDATDEKGNVLQNRIDDGPILTQEPVPVYQGDDADALKDRVLYQGEFQAYPRAVEWVLEGRVDFDPDTETITIDGDAGGRFPDRRVTVQDRETMLRYGENPHQEAAVYTDYTTDAASVVHAARRNEGAKALSYNNYNDADAALGLVAEFDAPAAAVIKHTNPAGCATADSLSTAYADALATDPMSAFGGIVALNRTCDEPTADRIVDSYKEVVVAPGFSDAALDVLRSKDNLRLLDVGDLDDLDVRPDSLRVKDLVGGQLVQERDDQRLTGEDLEVVTEREPTEAQVESMRFAWETIKHVKSNAILFADGTETVGIGMGQVSRVDAVHLAAMKADEHAEGKSAEGAVMASDAFFPFPDGVEKAAEAGIEGVIQPGGSKRDEQVIEAAEDLGLTMVLTGSRCFRHD